MSRVYLARAAGYERIEQALAAALTAFPGWAEPLAGKRVLVKPNLVLGRAPEKAATTHPALVVAVARALRAAGAEVIVGDSPGGPMNPAALALAYQASGLKAAAQAEGFALSYDCGLAETAYPQGRALRSLPLCAMAAGADAIVNLGKLKTHGMMVYTGAVKNLYGLIHGTHKLDMHMRFVAQDAFADLLLDVHGWARPALNIIDGVLAMEGDGPTAGSPRPLGALIVSDDAHAADVVGARLIGLTPDQVPTLRRAVALGLVDPAAVQVLGEDPAALAAPDFRPATPGRGKFDTFKGLLRSRPAFDPARCVGCGQCARVCPAHALTLAERLPRLDRKKCIACFCCHELCPHQAVDIRRPWVLRMLRG